MRICKCFLSLYLEIQEELLRIKIPLDELFDSPRGILKTSRGFKKVLDVVLSGKGSYVVCFFFPNSGSIFNNAAAPKVAKVQIIIQMKNNL